jgi:hypothetical protein
MGNQEFVFAYSATEKILPRVARIWPERCQSAFFDPAAGTQVSTATFDRKFRNALPSSGHRITFRLYLRYLLLCLHKTVLYCRYL